MSDIGKRLGQLPAEEIRELIYRPQLTSVNADDFKAMLSLNQAHLVMLSECGLVDAPTATTLARAMCTIAQQGVDTADVDTLLEDAYFAFETRLSSIAGTHAAGALHLARSRNDIGATLDRLRARHYALDISDALLEVRTQCVTRTAQYTDVIMPGYTHLQPAQPVSFAYYLSGYEVALARDSERIARSYDTINTSALGVAALAGSSFHIDRNRTAALLGFDGTTRHGLDTVASRDFVLELLSAVSILGTTWGKIMQDFHVFVSDEFASISFPDRVAGISSIMPQKKNPIALEFLKAQASRTLGAFVSSMSAARSSNFSVSLDAIREGLTDAWQTLAATPNNLALLRLIMETVEPRRTGLVERCNKNFSTATDLADGLVRQCNLSFREAHHIVGGVVKMALDLGVDATGITPAMIDTVAQDIIGKPLSLSAAFVHTCLDAEHALKQRTTQGGACAASVTSILDVSQHQLAQSRLEIDKRRQQLHDADVALQQAIQMLAH